jgi:large repetitive protein
VRSTVLGSLGLVACLVENPAWNGDSEPTTAASSDDTAGSDGTTHESAEPTESGQPTTEASASETSDSDERTIADVYAEVVLSDDPVAYWRLDEIAAPVAHDATANGYDGVYVGGFRLGDPGAFADGSSLAPRFEGAQWIEMGDILGFEGLVPFSIEVWFRLDHVGDGLNRAILAKNIWDDDLGSYFGIIMHAGEDVVSFRRDPNGWLGADIEVPSDRFTHMIGTFDGINQIIYVNGEQVAAIVHDNLLIQHDGIFQIGASANFTRFQGHIDQVSVYDYALSRFQVENHYATGRP